ncbi:MAG: TIR domain-containing protein [Actinobacteria bacterium]|nr:TIR domain-containing protein [Actinomycetota bacterium]
MAHDVFISHSSYGRNKLIADAICAELEKNRIRCWIAPRDIQPGTSFPGAIVEAINNSRVFVLVFSNDSNRSPQVLREVERAVHLGIPIIPFRIEDFPPSKDMEYLLSATHWLDAITPPLEKHLHKLAEIVQVILSKEAEEAPPPYLPSKELLVRPAMLWTGVVLLSLWLGWQITALFVVPGDSRLARLLLFLLLTLPLLVLGLLCLRRGLSSDMVRGRLEPPVRSWWWLLPASLGLLGGLISWRKHSPNSRYRAINMLTAGIVVTTLWFIPPAMLVGVGQAPATAKEEVAFYKVGEWKTPWTASDIYVSGDTAYLANGKGGLVVLDVSDPSNPENIGVCQLDNAKSVVVAGNQAYVIEQADIEGGEMDYGELVMMDVSAPSAPRKIVELRFEASDGFGFLGNLAVDGTTVYMPTSGRLVLWDLTKDPRSILLGEFVFNSNVVNPGVAARDGIGYIIANRLHVVDATDPSQPKEISGLETGWGSDLCLNENVAYAAGWDEGLFIVDISDPQRITTLGRFKEILASSADQISPTACRQIMGEVAVSGDVAYVSYIYGIAHETWMDRLECGIAAIDVSDPGDPRKLAVYSGFSEITGLAALDDLVFVTDKTQGLVILRLQ